MTVFRLLLAEIRYRWLNFFLSFLAMVIAGALFVGGPTLISGYTADTKMQLDQRKMAADEQLAVFREETEKKLAELDKKTRRIMRDIGVNLRIVHVDTKMGGLYTDFEAVAFDESDVEKLSQAKKIEKIVHIVATLQEKIKWNGRNVFIVGMLPMLTQSQKNTEKPHMVEQVEQGTVLLGYELRGDYQEGDTIEIEGISLKIAKIMPEMGTVNDVQLVVHLHDAQAVLNMPGKINQIVALNCKCEGNRISEIRAELEGVLPNTKVTEISNRATARENQRNLVAQKGDEQLAILQASADLRLADLRSRREQQESTLQSLAAVIVPLGVLVSATFIGLLTWLNVRERRPEIGLLRALGKGSMSISALFLGKAAMLGLLGGSVGCGLGYGLVIWLGSNRMGIPVSFFAPNFPLFIATVLGAPLVASVASYLPTISAVSQDPAVVLMDH